MSYQTKIVQRPSPELVRKNIQYSTASVVKTVPPKSNPPKVVMPTVVQQPALKPPLIRHIVPAPANPGSAHKICGIGSGKALIIVGNGPSITEVPLEKLKNKPNIHLMSINKPYPSIWPTEYWAFCDSSQYLRHQALWHDYEGIIINSTSINKVKQNTVQMRALHGFGFSHDLNKGFYIGRSTVFANMQTAIWMGYDHIYIFGVDMNPEGINGQLWFYGVNPDAEPGQRGNRFKAESEYYDRAVSFMQPWEVSRFTFCSNYNKWSFVDKYSRLDHTLAVDIILSRHS